MRSHLVACAVFVSIAVGAPVAALATGAGHIAINQHVRGSLGTCRYEVTLRGSYNALTPTDRDTRIENAFVDVQTTLTCPREAPLSSARQIYFAAGTERELLAHLTDAAAVQHAVRGTQMCTYSPHIERQADAIVITTMDTACTASEALAAAGSRRHAR